MPYTVIETKCMDYSLHMARQSDGVARMQMLYINFKEALGIMKESC